MNLIFRASCAAAVVLLTGWAVSGQTNPSSATPQTAYSESEPYQPRKFPDEKKPKKEKKSKKQEKPLGEASSQQQLENSVAVEPKPMSIPVSVFNGIGKLVDGLQPSDFKLFIDDQEKQISSVEIRSQPVNIILLLDTSPSAEMRVKEIQQYAIGIIEQLPPDDKMMVVSFNQDDRVLIDLTDDRKLLTKAINKWPKGDGTSLYDTITNIFRNRLEQIPGRKAVILLTDGIDTTSRKASYVSSLVEAEKGDAPVYPVYFDTLQETKNKIKSFPYAVSFPGLTLPSGQPQLSPEEESEIGKLYLNDLTNLSGGRAITYENVKSGKQRITIGIPQELRNQYIITFTPAGIAFAEQHRKVRVRVNRPNLVVVTRGSYIQQPPTQPKN